MQTIVNSCGKCFILLNPHIFLYVYRGQYADRDNARSGQVAGYARQAPNEMADTDRVRTGGRPTRRPDERGHHRSAPGGVGGWRAE